MKFDFPNKHGQILSGRLELPATKPRAFAIFAHCFTCSKDIVAPSVISKTLTDYGFGVLRFDFTGLGNSQGDFANTNFSSNIDDFLAAYTHLTEQYEMPEILIGHSFGGAAVLKAATLLDHVKAVVTIGAPSDASHVVRLLKPQIKNINQDGYAEVTLAGRQFTISKAFIDDVNEVDLLEGVKTFKKALLVMHAPLDDTVSIDHASKIFTAAQHPKSFVSLDSAEHLLMKRQDAEYAGRIIGAWVDRYTSTPMNSECRPVESGHVLVKSRLGSKFTQDIITKHHNLVADEPLSVKGNNLGMNPYELLLAALGACTSMTIKMYADRKEISLENIEVSLSHNKIHAKDCEECATSDGKIDVISKKILIEGSFSEEQKQRLLEIADKCPVNRTLTSEIRILNI